MVEAAWSQDAPADIVAVVRLALASIVDAAMVTDGRAAQGAQPPFATCWQLAPEVHAAGLAAESWGMFHQRWQVSPHGATQGQARRMAELLTTYTWPAGWEFIEAGPMVPDDTDIPSTWFYPLSFVYRPMV